MGAVSSESHAPVAHSLTPPSFPHRALICRFPSSVLLGSRHSCCIRGLLVRDLHVVARRGQGHQRETEKRRRGRGGWVGLLQTGGTSWLVRQATPCRVAPQASCGCVCCVRGRSVCLSRLHVSLCLVISLSSQSARRHISSPPVFEKTSTSFSRPDSVEHCCCQGVITLPLLNGTLNDVCEYWPYMPSVCTGPTLHL